MVGNDLEYSKQARSDPLQIKPRISGHPSAAIPFILWLAAIIWVVRVTVFIRGRRDFATVDLLAAIQILMVFVTIVAITMSGRMGKIWSESATRAPAKKRTRKSPVGATVELISTAQLVWC